MVSRSHVPRPAAWFEALEGSLSGLPVLHRLETISVGDLWGERFHTTRDHELICVLEGHARIEFRRRAFAVGPGDVFIIPAGTQHRDVRQESADYRVIYVFFAWPRGARVVRGIRASTIHGLPDGVKPHLHLMLKELEEAYLADDTDAHERVRVILLELLLALARYARPARVRTQAPRQSMARERRRKLAARVLDHVREHCADMIGLDALAEQFGVSPFYLSRSFSQEHGVSLFEMLALTRIERARKLLRAGRLSVKEVAACVGFSNANYFAKVFRRIAGVSPTEYQLLRRGS